MGAGALESASEQANVTLGWDAVKLKLGLLLLVGDGGLTTVTLGATVSTVKL
jgi:hypothetical protein